MSLEVKFNLWISSKETKEALELAALYNNPRNMTLCFSEADKNNYSHGGLIGKIFILHKEGYIDLEYSKMDENSSNPKIEYQTDSMSLTIKGEELLKSMSNGVFSSTSIKQIIISVIVAVLTVIILQFFGLKK